MLLSDSVVLFYNIDEVLKHFAVFGKCMWCMNLTCLSRSFQIKHHTKFFCLLDSKFGLEK